MDRHDAPVEMVPGRLVTEADGSQHRDCTPVYRGNLGFPTLMEDEVDDEVDDAEADEAARTNRLYVWRKAIAFVGQRNLQLARDLVEIAREDGFSGEDLWREPPSPIPFG